MPRTRSLKPSFFTDAELTLFPPLHRIAFEGLWVWADKRGLLEDKPRELKVQILPFDNVDFDAILTDLCRPKSDGGPGFIRRYQVNGKRYIHIRKFLDHQKPHFKETEFAHVPAPPEETRVEPGLSPGKSSADPEQAQGQSAGSGFLVLGSGNGSLVLGAGSPEPKPAPAPAPAIRWFAWAQEKRVETYPGLIPESPNPDYLGFYTRAMAKLKGEESRLDAAWQSFLEDQYGASKKPAFAMRVFQNDECWVKHVPEVAPRARGQPAPSRLNRPAPAPLSEEIPF